MADQINQDESGVIIELGGGTGSLTKGLLEAGIDPKRLLIFEVNPQMSKVLKKNFPECQVLNKSATHLSQVLREHNIHDVNCIVSGLPLLSLPSYIRDKIILNIFKVLKPHQKFIQFTYSWKSPLPPKTAEHATCKGKAVGKVWGNVPPATVWTFSKNK